MGIPSPGCQQADHLGAHLIFQIFFCIGNFIEHLYGHIYSIDPLEDCHEVVCLSHGGAIDDHEGGADELGDDAGDGSDQRCAGLTLEAKYDSSQNESEADEDYEYGDPEDHVDLKQVPVEVGVELDAGLLPGGLCFSEFGFGFVADVAKLSVDEQNGDEGNDKYERAIDDGLKCSPECLVELRTPRDKTEIVILDDR